MLLIFLSAILIHVSADASNNCIDLYPTQTPGASQASLLSQAKTRLQALGSEISSKFRYQMMKLKSTKDAREQNLLPVQFINTVEWSGSKFIIPFNETNANEFVTVYRVITLKSSKHFDPNSNYVDGHTPRAAYRKWDGDFVTHDLGWTWVYGEGEGHDILIKYLIPAKLLAIDESMSKPEPYYIISKTKLQNEGIRTLAPFIAGIAKVQQYKFYEYDPGFRKFESVRRDPKNENDPKLQWMTDEELSAFIVPDTKY